MKTKLLLCAMAIMFTLASCTKKDATSNWHSVNGENAEEMLPAILITNRHPKKFKETLQPGSSPKVEGDLKMIFIPLKKFCNNTTDVIKLVEKLFNDVKSHKDLNDFRIAKELKKGVGRAIADSIILEPNFAGLGFNLIR